MVDANKKIIDLLAVAKALEPRILEDMPQEVADAFSNNQVQRIFRTSGYLPSPIHDPQIIKAGLRDPASAYGDYSGSVYVQLKDGRIARFKNPEQAILGGDERHSGWKAKTAGLSERSPFFDHAQVYDKSLLDDPNSLLSRAIAASRRANPGVTGITTHIRSLSVVQGVPRIRRYYNT